MAERDIPLSVFHFDCFWMRELHWCDFEWDPRVFPDPPGMLRRLKERGLRICVWINPYISQHSKLFEEGRDGGYLVRTTGRRACGSGTCGSPGWGWSTSPTPRPREWFTGKLDALLDMGVDCFKTDFGERVPTDVAWYDGSDPERMHNYYTYLYNQTVFELLTKRRGAGRGRGLRPVGHRRVASSSRCTGAATASRRSRPMAGDLRGGLSLGMSGFGFWSHDIGGFEGTPDPALFKRWLAFGLLSSHSRLHGNSSYRVPWEFDEEAVDVTAEVHPAEGPADAVPLPGRPAGRRRGHPGDAGDGPGVPRRSRVHDARAAVHARRRPAGGAGAARRRPTSTTTSPRASGPRCSAAPR